MENDVEIEINLRRYLSILLHRWRWIVGMALVVALAALILSFLQPPTYEATALVAITKPQYDLNFDSRFSTIVNTNPAYKAYPELAKSDDLLRSVFDRLTSPPKGIETVADLDSALTAQSGIDSSIVQLRVRVQNPNDAAHIANIWAEVFITRASELYGLLDQTQIASFEAQVASAEKELQADEQALIDYQAHDQSSILQTQLSSALQMQADYLASQRSIAYLQQDIAGLRKQMDGQPVSNSSGLADRLSALFLQLKAYQVQAEVPIQLQFSDPNTLAAASVAEQVAFLDRLSGSLQAQESSVAAQMKKLEPQILTLQQQLQAASAEKDRLTRARDVSRQTAMTLAQKVEETRIAVQSNKGEVQLASHAAVPDLPISSRKLVNTMLGGMAGLILGAIVAFLADWRRNRMRNQQQVPEVRTTAV
jgi:uncharacterized protein involved in exopolysaccharide biosynthesis